MGATLITSQQEKQDDINQKLVPKYLQKSIYLHSINLMPVEQQDICARNKEWMHGPSDIFSTHCVVVSSLYDRWATTFTASIQDAVIFMAHSFLSPYPLAQPTV